jgi:hypothetical protein
VIAIIQHKLDCIVVSAHDRQNRRKSSLKFKKTFQESCRCLLATALVAGVALQIMSVGAMKSKKAALISILILVFDIHLFSKPLSQIYCLFNASMGERSSPLKYHQHFNYFILTCIFVCFICIEFDWLQLHLSVKSVEETSLEDIFALDQLCDALTLLI